MSLSLKDTDAGIKLKGPLQNNFQFADDILLLTRCGPELQNIMTQVDTTSRRFGLIINAEKSKTMVIEKTKQTPTETIVSFLACPNAEHSHGRLFGKCIPQPLVRKAWGRCPAVSMNEIYSALMAWHPAGFSVWVVSHSPDTLPR